MNRQGAKQNREDWNYEVAVAQVEAIAARIESGELEGETSI